VKGSLEGEDLQDLVFQVGLELHLLVCLERTAQGALKVLEVEDVRSVLEAAA